jgi:hypothetical protein
VLVMFFGGVRVGDVFWWGSCWSCFLVGFVLVMFLVLCVVLLCVFMF